MSVLEVNIVSKKKKHFVSEKASENFNRLLDMAFVEISDQVLSLNCYRKF